MQALHTRFCLCYFRHFYLYVVKQAFCITMLLFCMDMFSLFIFVTFIMYVILLYAFTTPFLNKVFLEFTNV